MTTHCVKRVTQTCIASLIAALLLGTLADAQVRTRVCDLSVPAGYHRAPFDSLQFAGWVQRLPLSQSKLIMGHDGSEQTRSFYNTMAVVDMPLLFTSDIEQCADWAMRLWAEFHQATSRLDSLYLFDYNGARRMFRSSGKSVKAFLKWAFANTNSHSLKRGCGEVYGNQLRPGDLFVQNQQGGIGHVSVVVDKCTDSTGRALYLVGYSFMPAQQFHIEAATGDYGMSGWFTLEGYRRYLADNLDLGTPVLRRFGGVSSQ